MKTSQSITTTTKARISVISSLYRCERYLDEYFKAVAAIEHPEEVEVLLLHNDPTEHELALIEQWTPKVRVHLRHIVIPQREGLYRTWNRGIDLAEGEYLAVWNVDDQRTPASLHLQADALDANPRACLCYGSYIGVQRFAAREGLMYVFSDFSRMQFLRSCYLTPFPLWRKSVHETIGMFDEAFRSAGDYDFQLRAARTFDFVRIDDVCGYYLEAPESGISKSGDINNIERTVCELRYAIYDKLNLLYVPVALRYSLDSLHWKEADHELWKHFKALALFRFVRSWSAPLSILRLPINILRYIKHRVLPRLRASRSSHSSLQPSTLTPR